MLALVVKVAQGPVHDDGRRVNRPGMSGDWGQASYRNGVQKYVVSATLTDPAWQHTTVLTGAPVVAVRTLKQQAGKDIVLTGSITLAHPLIRAGLVDEFRLFV